VDLADEVHQGLVLGHPAEDHPRPRGVGGEGEDLLELGGAEGAGDQDREADVLRAQSVRSRTLVAAFVSDSPFLSRWDGRGCSGDRFGRRGRTELPEVPAGGDSGKAFAEVLALLPAQGFSRGAGLVMGIGIEPGRPLGGLDPRLDRSRLVAQRSQRLVALRIPGHRQRGEDRREQENPCPTRAYRPFR
jgi:hypothetical protein